MNVLVRLFLYLFGTLRIRLQGDYCERMLNIMATRSITFWRPKRIDNYVYLTIKMSDFKKIKAFRKNADVKIKIMKKSGFPLIARRYRKRYGLIVGIIAFLTVLNFLSSRVWLIKINGNIETPKSDIINFFSMNGVASGVSMNKIDSDILKQKLIIDFNNIAWASINKQGSVIEVNLTEFSNTINKDKPCNIVANKDAIIKKITISKGSVNVKIGDTVSKNQVVVSGIVDFGAGSVFVHPEGEIIGEIREERTVKIPKIKEETIFYENTKNRYLLNVMGTKIPLYLGSVSGEYFFSQTEKELVLFGGEIPISLTCRNFDFYTKSARNITQREAETISDNLLNEWFKDNDCVSFKYNLKNTYETKNDYVYIYDTVFLCDIGRKTPLVFE